MHARELEDVAIIERAREAPPERQRVYFDTIEGRVLAKYSPIRPSVLRGLTGRMRWVLLTEWTVIETEHDD